MPRLLAVDDDPELLALLAEYLATHGFEVASASSGEAALKSIDSGTPDLVLLDVTMPGWDGFETLRRIRAISKVPLLMLTARGEEVDRVVGLEIGADDYLSKPFSLRELVARVNAILRRSQGTGQTNSAITVGDLCIRPLSRTAHCGGILLALTGAEYDVLALLAASAGELVAREKLFEIGLSRTAYSIFDRAVDNHVSALRKKMGPLPGGLERIRSIRGAGYILVSSDAT